MIMRCSAPIDTSKTQFLNLCLREHHGRNGEWGQEDSKCQRTSIYCEIDLLEMTGKFHPWCLNNMAA